MAIREGKGLTKEFLQSISRLECLKILLNIFNIAKNINLETLNI